jgi:hypothetical protein
VIKFLILDLATALWVTAIALLLGVIIPRLAGVPSQSLGDDGSLSRCDRLIDSLSKSVLLMAIGVLILSALSLFNWATLVLWYAGGLLGFRYLDDRQKTLKQLQFCYHQGLYLLFDLLDQQVSWATLQTRWQLTESSRQTPKYRHSYPGQVAVLAIAIALGFALLLRYEHPLLNLRLSTPDAYALLLNTRQILAAEGAKIVAPAVASGLAVYAGLAAALSMLSAVDPMQVIRFLGALMGMGLVLSVGYSVQRLIGDRAGWVALFSLGAYLFTCDLSLPDSLPLELNQFLGTVITQLNTSLIRQWAGAEPELGAMFALLAVTQVDRGINRQQRQAWIAVGCCSAIAALTAPALLLIVVLGLGVATSRRGTITLIAIGWVSLGLAAALPASPSFLQTFLQSFLITLPVGLSLLCGVGFAIGCALVDRFLRLRSGNWASSIALVLIFALSVNFLLPPPATPLYLEPEISAREALALSGRFPAKQWVLVAPIEQLAETYGSAWYIDLAEFVAKYGDRVNQPHFRFPFEVADLLVFVEKQPFKTFPAEPAVIANGAALDPVYLNYRSLAGRSSLQFAALQLCETYRQTHPDTAIDYEDETLRVYHFRLPKKASADSNILH